MHRDATVHMWMDAVYVILNHTSTTTTHPPLPHTHHYHTPTTTTHPPLPHIHHYHTPTTTTHPPLPHIHHYHTSTTTTHVNTSATHVYNIPLVYICQMHVKYQFQKVKKIGQTKRRTIVQKESTDYSATLVRMCTCSS